MNTAQISQFSFSHCLSRNLRKFPKLRASKKHVLQSVLYIVAIASFHFGLFGLQLSPDSFQVRAQLPSGPPRADGPLGGEGLLVRRRGGHRVPHEQGGVRQDEVKNNSESKYLGERRACFFFKKNIYISEVLSATPAGEPETASASGRGRSAENK